MSPNVANTCSPLPDSGYAPASIIRQPDGSDGARAACVQTPTARTADVATIPTPPVPGWVPTPLSRTEAGSAPTPTAAAGASDKANGTTHLAQSPHAPRGRGKGLAPAPATPLPTYALVRCSKGHLPSAARS